MSFNIPIINITLEQLFLEINKFKLYYEFIPYNGIMDSEKMIIIINPIFTSKAEILLHEILHYLYPKSTEWFIRETAKDLINNNSNLEEELNNYINKHTSLRGTSNIFITIGI